MLLQELKLHNIRSYTQQTVQFPPGSILLSGDIGSGKSSLLLAIEFALFGASRPDLPAESLLRKGAMQGSVELLFRLGGRDFSIKRNLKREKETIKQVAGHLITGELKKDLTAVELKAEMLSLLGYPEDYLNKGRNYLFRYAVYTPQEEMKLILQEDAEIRLDTLRKIFDLDKYKIIRENLGIFLKQLRVELAVLRTRLEPLPGLQEWARQLAGEGDRLEKHLEEKLPQQQGFLKLVQVEQIKLEELEKAAKQYQEHLSRRQLLQAQVSEKQKNVQLVEQQKLGVEIRLESFPALDLSVEKARQQLQFLQEQKQQMVTAQTRIQAQLQQLQKQIREMQQEIQQKRQEVEMLPAKELEKSRLEERQKGKIALVQRNQELENLFSRALELIVRNETILAQAVELKENLANLLKCPTCLQQVSESHRQEIMTKEAKTIVQAENLLFETRKRRSQILQQRQELMVQLEQLAAEENRIACLGAEIAQLRQSQAILEQKEKQLKNWVQQNNLLRGEVEKPNALPQLEKELSQRQESLQLLVQQAMLMQQQKELQQHYDSLRKEILELQEVLQQLSWLQLADPATQIKEVKQLLADLTAKEREAALEIGKFQAQLQGQRQQQEESEKKVQGLLQEQLRLKRLQELYHWLDDFFLPLTYTLEKQVMGNIHHQFSQLFQEWFSTLMGDETISCRIDEAFTPIVEMNGYEIDFENLSGGEKTSASLAYRLALNRAINDFIPEIKTKDLLILDEPTDGFSSEQLDKVREVLERLQMQQIIIVSHESKIESFVQHVLRVQKEGHESVVM